jgi:hypothetical protein
MVDQVWGRKMEVEKLVTEEQMVLEAASQMMEKQLPVEVFIRMEKRGLIHLILSLFQLVDKLT